MINHTATHRRITRVRSKLRAVSSRPRLSVFRSNAHIWAQLIDDQAHKTLAAVNDFGLTGTKLNKATGVGNAIAALALKTGIKQITFDRGGYRYHGRVKALAEAARLGGLEF